jgi:hypothetical protein
VKDETGVKEYIKLALNKPKGISDANLLKVALSQYLDFADITVLVNGPEQSDSFTLTASGTLEMVKKNKSSSIKDWQTFELKMDIWKQATLMFYPERETEINTHITNLRSFRDVNIDNVVGYDAACRYKISSRREITLDRTIDLTDAYTSHILRGIAHRTGPPRLGLAPSQNPEELKQTVCRNWNNDRCSMPSCLRKHVCLRCGENHQVTQCTSALNQGTQLPHQY